MFLGLTHGRQELVRKIPNIGLSAIGSCSANLHNSFSLKELLKQRAGWWRVLGQGFMPSFFQVSRISFFERKPTWR